MDLADADVGRQKSLFKFDGPFEVAPGDFFLVPLQEQPPDFVFDSEENDPLFWLASEESGSFRIFSWIGWASSQC